MEIFENIIEGSTGNHYFLKFGNYSSINIVKSPTGNCQIFSIRDFKSLLTNPTLDKIGQIKYIAKKFNRPILLCDIEEKYSKIFDETFKKESIIMKSEYVSTINSKMIICMINTKNL